MAYDIFYRIITPIFYLIAISYLARALLDYFSDWFLDGIDAGEMISSGRAAARFQEACQLKRAIFIFYLDGSASVCYTRFFEDMLASSTSLRRGLILQGSALLAYLAISPALMRKAECRPPVSPLYFRDMLAPSLRP